MFFRDSDNIANNKKTPESVLPSGACFSPRSLLFPLRVQHDDLSVRFFRRGDLVLYRVGRNAAFLSVNICFAL